MEFTERGKCGPDGRLIDEALLDEISPEGVEPAVSIIIPVYNSEKYLNACLDSAANQTLKNIEIICVNDGSADSSGQILAEYARKDSRIHVFDQANAGQGTARNLALSKANGRYIQFLDSDDMLQEDALMQLCRYAEYFETDILFYEADAFYETQELEEERPIDPAWYYRKGAYPDTEDGKQMFLHLRRETDLKGSAGPQMLRRAFLTENEITFLTGIVHEDDLFTLQCLSLAERVHVLKDTRYYLRRIHAGSTMTDANHFKRAYGRFKVACEMTRFIQENALLADEVFYESMMHYLLVECESAMNELSDMTLSEVWEFAMRLEEGEREAFILSIYQKKRDFVLHRNHVLELSRKLKRFTTVRIDLKNSGSEDNDLIGWTFADPVSEAQEAFWLTDGCGHGYYAEAEAFDGEKVFTCRFFCKGSGLLQMAVRGMNVPGEDGKRIPYWIDILGIQTDGEDLLEKPVCVWHDRPFKYEKTVADGQEVEIKVRFRAHADMGEEDLRKERDRLKRQTTALKKQTAELEKQLSAVRESKSYRLGRMLTAPVRRIKKAH